MVERLALPDYLADEIGNVDREYRSRPLASVLEGHQVQAGCKFLNRTAIPRRGRLHCEDIFQESQDSTWWRC